MARKSVGLLMVLAAGCTDVGIEQREADTGDSELAEIEALLDGEWAWRPDVAHIAVGSDLQARQSSVFDAEGAAPSEYELIVWSEEVLFLDGWFALNDPCEASDWCDSGRAHQLHMMTSYVDDALWLPYALLPVDEGRYEASGVRMDYLDGPDSEPSTTWIDTWTLELTDDGRFLWQQLREVYAEGADAASPPVLLEEPYSEVIARTEGEWRWEGERLLTVDEDGEAHEFLLAGEALSLTELVFERVR
jgi:hypothetical protein